MEDAAVSERSWMPVLVDNTELLAKAWFGDTQYRVLLSDLHFVWAEEMQAEAIGTRAQELNKRLRAPVQAFFSHLRTVAQPCLSGQSSSHDSVEANFSLQRHDDCLTVRLKSELAGVPFHWEFRLRPAPVTVVCRQLVRPLLAMTKALHRQVEELSGLLVRKDAEILDYKENGAVLTRERLLTDVFDEERHRQNFFSQMLPQMGAAQEDVSFSPELQELYAAVSTQLRRRKRRHSSSTDDTHAHEEEGNASAQDLGTHQTTHTQREGTSGSGSRSISDQSLTPSLDVQNPGQPSRGASRETQKVESEQTVPQMPVPVDRPAPQRKKKKAVGLFR